MAQPPTNLQQLVYTAEQMRKAGRHAEALSTLDQLLMIAPDHVHALHLRGVTLGSLGQLDESIKAFRAALARDPGLVECYNNLGVALTHAKKHQEAIAAFGAAVQLRFDWMDPHHNLAHVFMELERYQDAVRELEQTARLAPNLPSVHNNLGTALRFCERPEDAIQAYEVAVRKNPKDLVAMCNLGRSLAEIGRLERAIATQRAVLAIDPDEINAKYSLGIALNMIGQYEAALEMHDKVIAVNPRQGNVQMNRAMTLRNLGRFEEAYAAHRESVAQKPTDGDTHSCYAFSLLVDGDFERGWPEFEWRLQVKGFGSPFKSNPPPRWDGSPLNGRTILIHSEQGHGDTIQFIRYAPLLAAMGGRVICRRRPAMARLFESVTGVSQWIDSSDPLPRCDVHCPLLSLPMAMGTRLENIPAPVPYLHAPPALLGEWKQRLDTDATGGLRVGIVWQGNPLHKNDFNRSVPASYFSALSGVKNVRFVSLQKAQSSERASPPPGMKLFDLTGHFSDYADTAALITHLDLVISVDTSVAHLAGALGKPVWVLVPYAPDWRWLLHREDSPWYPSMRLFRQRKPWLDGWPEVIERVRVELMKAAGNA